MTKNIFNFIVLTAVFCAFSGDVLYAGDEKKDEQEKISAFIQGLAGKYQEERLQCKNELLRIGTPAEEQLVSALESEKFYVRLYSLQILGEIKSAKAVPAIVKILSDSQNQEIKGAAREALMANYGAVKEYLAKNKAAGPGLIKEFDELQKIGYRVELEKCLLELIPENGMPGFYEGQFDGLKKLGRDVLPFLIEMAREEYEFVYIKDDYKKRAATGLAVDSLGMLGDESVIPVLKAVYEDYGLTEGGFGDSAAYALYRLGQKDIVDEWEQDLKNNVDGGINVGNKTSALAILYVRTNQIDKAIAQYESSLPQMNNFFPILGNTYYNLSCLYSTKKDIKKALEYLRLAVENGYDDYEWITMDGDMKPLMKEPEFDEITARIKRSLPGKDDTDKKTTEETEIY
ncbi:MAG: HEAT repeat domain-containing protein [Planctomycetes bacterium]|nr:HEAT repeat domain-containing protein [Planctomycetota bacterium]